MTATKPSSSDTNHRDDNREFFDEWSATYERGRMSSWFQHYQARVLEHVDSTGSGDLLDVGCGSGWLARAAARRYPDHRFCGADLSGGMIDAARAEAVAEGQTNLSFIQADSASLPFSPESFDFITCTASFHHYPEPVKVLEGWRRLLRPGGRFLLLESCTTYLPIWVYDKFFRVAEKGHVRYYRTDELVEFGRRAGFDDVQSLWRERGMFKRGKLFTSLVLVAGRKT